MFPTFVGKYPGDALWALMVFLLWGIVFPTHSTVRVALTALATSFLVEFSQLYRAPWINDIRATTLGRLILRSGFAWEDLLAYSVGITIGSATERIVNSRKDRGDG
jgi:hypothetical protein